MPLPQKPPVGAAPPRRQQQVIDILSRGDAPPTKTTSGSGTTATPMPGQRPPQPRPSPSHKNLLWERHRRDANARSTTASAAAKPLPQKSPVGAAPPRRQCPVNDRLSRGQAPPTKISCGSGTAATQDWAQTDPMGGNPRGGQTFNRRGNTDGPTVRVSDARLSAGAPSASVQRLVAVGDRGRCGLAPPVAALPPGGGGSASCTKSSC